MLVYVKQVGERYKMSRILKINKQNIEIGMDNGKIYTFDRKCCKQILQVGDTVQIYGQNPDYIIMLQTTPESRAINRLANIIREMLANMLLIAFITIFGLMWITTLKVIGIIAVTIIDLILVIRLIGKVCNL